MTPDAEALAARHRPYHPYGAAEQLMYDRRPEVLLSGPAGTGKSRACLEKLHLVCEKYPGARCLIVRKTRASCTESVLVTFEDKVVPEGHPVLDAGGQRSHRQAYSYPNGSSIVVGGLDKATRIMSTEYDLIYVQEAIELADPEWEALTTRLRNGKVPYQQLIADTNPDAPTHWLKRRCDSGAAAMLDSRHEDNPSLWRQGAWTQAGALYIARLEALTGPRLQRLRHGRWVQAEGVVYDGFDPARHLLQRFAIPADWPRLLSIDFGYTHPFVAQWWAIDGDGRLYLYREIYHTGRLVQDHAARILELSKDEPPPVAVITDHDAEDRATLERYLERAVTPAVKAKSPGIQAVASRLRPAGDGKPRLYFLRDSLDERDPALADARKPCSTVEEFDSYVWDVRAGRARGEEPVKDHDHGMDAMRYCVWGLDCDSDVEDERPTVARAR